MDPLVSQKIDQFFSAYAPRTFDKGHILIRAHEQPPFVFHLTSGRVKQYDISYRGDQVILNVFKPPAFFPMSSARSRLLYELLIEARRFGVVSGPGATLEINESDIGARAGLARETVSREMSKLKDEGLISVIKNEIHINDLERLASLISREL
jgi:CRP-like cAMP-binding protein